MRTNVWEPQPRDPKDCDPSAEEVAEHFAAKKAARDQANQQKPEAV